MGSMHVGTPHNSRKLGSKLKTDSFDALLHLLSSGHPYGTAQALRRYTLLTQCKAWAKPLWYLTNTTLQP